MSNLMLNRDVFSTDPSQRKLENEGVANVNDERTVEQLNVLKYELETFVCSGQYADGLDRILRSFLSNIDKAEQPAVWVSGFYGSGKSHLVKMLRALWVNQTFSDSQTARNIATLPEEVNDALIELDAAGRRLGGLHAASGTLGAGASQSVRLALLGILFKSVDLPEEYSAAMLVLWLKREGKLEVVEQHLTAVGRSLSEELPHMYVSHPLWEALFAAFPEMATSSIGFGELLNNQYRPQDDITSDQLIDAIRLSLTNENGHFPLSLVVLDEVQQYIGQDDTRSIAVQEALEAISKRFAGRLLFIGTGQAALTGTAKLNKLEGRFPVRVQLRDEDVDEVVRKVVLSKKTSVIPALDEIRDANVGELNRHLANTQIATRPRDAKDFARDYPILPVRRRFWEHALRALDTTSVKSQLRNQLGLVHRVVQSNLDEPLGHVVPADALFFESAPSLVQSRALSRRVHDFAVNGEQSMDADTKITARAVGIVYLINQIKKDQTSDALGLKSDVVTIADLLVTDLNNGSSALRAKLPGLLNECDLLDIIDGEYLIQTKESAEWRDRFERERGNLGGNQIQIDAERDERIRRAVSEELRNLKLQQGKANVPRNVGLSTTADVPSSTDSRIVAWVPGLTHSRDDIEQAAREAGANSPVIFVYLPLEGRDDLRTALIDFKAAEITLNTLVATNTNDGNDAKASMETIKKSADQRINSIVAKTIENTRVYQGGGIEVIGSGLYSLVEAAAKKNLVRLYPKFEVADHTGWGKVLDQARRGTSDSFRQVGHLGDLKDHTVAKRILDFVAGAKTGKEVHDAFEGSPYGWSSDAIDGTLLALLQATFIRAENLRGQPAKLGDLNKTEISKTKFATESVRIGTGERIAARGLISTLVPGVQTGAELESLDAFYTAFDTLAKRAGGPPPLPAPPSLPKELQGLLTMSSTNERLAATASAAEKIRGLIDTWQAQADLAERRSQDYAKLERILAFVDQLPESKEKSSLLIEATALKEQRLLLTTADPIAPLEKSACELLRAKLAELEKAYTSAYDSGTESWIKSPHYAALTQDQRHQVLQSQSLTQQPKFSHGSAREILETLSANNFEQLRTRVEVIATRFDRALEAAKELAQPDAPKATKVHLVRRDLHNDADIATWLDEAGQLLSEKLSKGGPVRPD